ncbi:MAG: ATP-binding protein [Alphaproteobacteria bacterium]|nr:ATP-binding protein [Alphaproteobacteria bacterium]
MIKRILESDIVQALSTVPVLALLGPRQVGKTTLATSLAAHVLHKESVYLDLELDSHLARFDDTESYLRQFDNKLLIIDEVQRKPDLFPILRSIVDMRKRAGEKAGHFLLLGSASRDLLQHSSESLAGRIRYLELAPFSIKEVSNPETLDYPLEKLWLRGGFPESYLATDNNESWRWRSDFISTYVERDIPLMGPQISPTRMRRFWSMLAHYHGQQIHFSEIGKSLETSHTTVKNYLDILIDFYMVRLIPAWSGNTKKRLTKMPKVYIRDSGILHRLLNISSFDDLLGHSSCGASFEGYIIENILRHLNDKWHYSYYRNSDHQEIDLILEGPNQSKWAIEIKRSSSPKINKGFHDASDAIGATKKFVLYSGTERFPLSNQTEALGILEFLEILENFSSCEK